MRYLNFIVHSLVAIVLLSGCNKVVRDHAAAEEESHEKMPVEPEVQAVEDTRPFFELAAPKKENGDNSRPANRVNVGADGSVKTNAPNQHDK